VDYVFVGESDPHFLSLIKGEPLDCIPNMGYKSNDKIIQNSTGILYIEDINSIPIPAYHLMPMGLYRPSIGDYKRLPAMGMITSRGCPGKCSFCFVGTNGKRIRYRNTHMIVEEIRYLQLQYGIQEISFYDDNFTTSKNRVKEFCNNVIEKNISVSWTCASRVDTVDMDLLNLMAHAGCHSISYGVESGDEYVLKLTNKNINLNKAREAIQLTKKAGIDAKIFLMVGLPGETEGSLNNTMKFAFDTEPDEIIVSIATPFPGTNFYNWAKAKNILLTSEWSEFDTSKPIVALPTVAPETVIKYYKKIQLRFYLRPWFIIHRLLRSHSWQDIKRDMIAFFAIIRAYLLTGK
jgi:radical SAM superfamily enzyme YgiQ (UPF0313 family)